MDPWDLIQTIAKFEKPDAPIIFEYTDDNGVDHELFVDTFSAVSINNKIRVECKEVKLRGAR
jgi:hypothetical protein